MPRNQPPRFRKPRLPSMREQKLGDGEPSAQEWLPDEEAETEEVDLFRPGREIEWRPPPGRGSYLIGGLVLAGLIILFLILASGISLVTWNLWLDEAEPTQKVAHLEKLLMWLFGTLAAVLAPFLYFFRRRR